MSNTFQWLWVKKLKQQFECIRPWHSPVSVPDFPEVSMVFHSSRGIYLTQRINARIETVLITHDCPPTYIICNFSLTDASRSASKQADICLLYGISFKNAWCYRKCHNFLKRTWKSVHKRYWLQRGSWSKPQMFKTQPHLTDVDEEEKTSGSWDFADTRPLTARHSVCSSFGRMTVMVTV